MKKAMALLLALCLCLGCSAALADAMVVHITAVCYDLNHVGTEWTAAYTMGGVELTDGQLVDLVPGKYDFAATVADLETNPDVGTGEMSFNVTENRLQKGFSFTQTVQVAEDRGVYKGYWNEWYVTYDFTPVEGAAYVLN